MPLRPFRFKVRSGTTTVRSRRIVYDQSYDWFVPSFIIIKKNINFVLSKFDTGIIIFNYSI